MAARAIVSRAENFNGQVTDVALVAAEAAIAMAGAVSKEQVIAASKPCFGAFNSNL